MILIYNSKFDVRKVNGRMKPQKCEAIRVVDGINWEDFYWPQSSELSTSIRELIQHDLELEPLLEKIEDSNSIISSILRMICYQKYPNTRTTLSENFPFDLKFVEKSRMISFMEDVIKFGAGSVRKERVFVVGHQGSGKTSLVHSVR